MFSYLIFTNKAPKTVFRGSYMRGQLVKSPTQTLGEQSYENQDLQIPM